MSDFPCVRFVQKIPVTGVEFIDNTTLKLIGSDVRRATRVLINNTQAPEMLIASKTDLLVTIPVSQRNVPISTLAIVGDSDEVASVVLTARTTQQMTDSLYALQRFLRLLLTRRGSDAFEPDVGTTLLDIVGSRNYDSVAVDIVSAIKEAEQQLRRTQVPRTSLSKIVSMVEVLDVSYSVNTLTASVSLSLVMATGNRLETSFQI